MRVREVIKIIEGEGWFMIRMKGSHRQYKHPDREGVVTIAGNLSDELAKGTLNSVLKQSGLKYGSKKSAEIPDRYRKTKKNYSAYSPDLPGCVATGATARQTLSRMKSAIKFHLDGLKKQGDEIPEPSTRVEYIEIAI